MDVSGDDGTTGLAAVCLAVICSKNPVTSGTSNRRRSSIRLVSLSLAPNVQFRRRNATLTCDAVKQIEALSLAINCLGIGSVTE